MAPPTEKVRLQNTLYTVQLLSGEMESLAQQIASKKETIGLLQSQILSETQDLNNFQTQLMTLYIQITGTFPSAV